MSCVRRAFVDAETGRRVSLRIGIDDEHAPAEHRERRAEIDGGRALSDAAFLIDERDDATQGLSRAMAVGRDRDTARAFAAASVRSLRSGSSVTCSKSQRNAAPTRSSPRKLRRRFAAANERRNDVVAVDGELANGEGRLARELGADARLERPLPPSRFGQAAAANVGVPQCEQTFDILRFDPPDETAQRRVAQLRIGRVHVLTDGCHRPNPRLLRPRLRAMMKK